MDQPQLPKTRPTLFTHMFGATRYVMTVASSVRVAVIECLTKDRKSSDTGANYVQAQRRRKP